MAFLTQAIIADDQYMRLRVASCAAQEGCADVGIDPDAWTLEWRRVWAAAPQWDVAWEQAVAGGATDPGRDAITDPQILTQVQTMTPFTHVADHAPQAAPCDAAP